jgi:hypothetical protein
MMVQVKPPFYNRDFLASHVWFAKNEPIWGSAWKGFDAISLGLNLPLFAETFFIKHYFFLDDIPPRKFIMKYHFPVGYCIFLGFVFVSEISTIFPQHPLFFFDMFICSQWCFLPRFPILHSFFRVFLWYFPRFPNFGWLKLPLSPLSPPAAPWLRRRVSCSAAGARGARGAGCCRWTFRGCWRRERKMRRRRKAQVQGSAWVTGS